VLIIGFYLRLHFTEPSPPFSPVLWLRLHADGVIGEYAALSKRCVFDLCACRGGLVQRSDDPASLKLGRSLGISPSAA
jgi:hypothetical protein